MKCEKSYKNFWTNVPRSTLCESLIMCTSWLTMLSYVMISCLHNLHIHVYSAGTKEESDSAVSKHHNYWKIILLSNSTILNLAWSRLFTLKASSQYFALCRVATGSPIKMNWKADATQRNADNINYFYFCVATQCTTKYCEPAFTWTSCVALTPLRQCTV